MTLSLRQLAYFVAVAEERHFGRAAERVHVTQPALSMQIREMEDHLGTHLLERGRTIHLTPTGREVLAHARAILAQVAEIEGLARRQTFGGRVNIGVIPTVAPYLLPDLLTRLPMQLRLREAQTEVLMASLDAGALDALVIASPVDRDDLTVVPLFTDRFLLASSKARLDELPSVEALRPHALDPYDVLLLDEGHCLADQAMELCGMKRHGVRLDLGASSLTTLAGLVARGMGFTFLPEIAVATECAAHPDLRLARFASPQPSRKVTLVGRRSTSAEPWFMDLADALRQTAIAVKPQAHRAI